MTVCFPPLIKPDRRFSRIRLSEFHLRSASLSSSECGSESIQSVIFKEIAARPAFLFPRRIPVLAPEPLPEPVGDEVIHLPKASVVVGEGKVMAPASGHLVDFTHDPACLFPGGVMPGEFAHPLSQCLPLDRLGALSPSAGSGP